MKIAMVDLKRQYATIKNEIDSAVHDVIESTQFILGKHVGEFECGCAGYLNAKYALGCASGTDALQIIMMAMGIKPGDEVITTPFTFIATAETIAILGAVPVYVDIDEKTYNIDPKKIEAAITSKTKAVIPVHLYGQATDLDPIIEIAKKYNLSVIEDAAQAFGTEYKGKKVGALADAGATSFFPSKNLGAYGDAGMVFTNDEKLYEKMKMVAAHGSRERYIHEIPGINSRLDTLQAAILNVKLKYIEQWNKSREHNAKLYCERLSSGNVIVPFVAEFSNHIYHQFSIRVQDRKGLQEFLASREIPVAVHYPVPLHHQPAFKHLSEGLKLPVVEKITQEIISLPMYPELSVEEIDYITSNILEFVGNK
ncbi:MAG: DegT/DnrJ/EryC1/StrS family aminotransferase [Ignavibacteria bacterium]